jgi:hypothetical protein
VEAAVGETVVVRDSKQNALGLGQPTLEIDYDGWLSFFAELRSDPSGGSSGSSSLLCHQVSPDGTVEMWLASDAQKRLAFDADEWTAFLAGVEAGEFTREFAALHP